MTLNVESKIHSQPRVASEIGAAHGRRIRKRTTDLPANFFMSARARTLPSTITAVWEMTVKRNVFFSERWKTGLATTARKFRSPTKEMSRLPADELLTLSTSARRNGT